MTRSQGIGVNADGTSGNVTHEDTVVRGERGRRADRWCPPVSGHHRSARAVQAPSRPEVSST
ncbi:hypothetical protein AB0C40_17920 [Streptomyces brevispora]|uniref:hypothetical protein n=1 Tax=Streptomyces brevispora TaxID=887462 RepID=UPI0033E056CA